jgi:hypothetical protein
MTDISRILKASHLLAKKRKESRAKNLTKARQRALRIFRKEQFKNYEDAAKRFTLKEIGKGCGSFRRSYRIMGTDLLIKFPRIDAGQRTEGKQHTRDEVKKIQILLKYKAFQKHIPPVYYYNRADGVFVTKFYPGRKWIKARWTEFVSKLVHEHTGIWIDDITGDNLKTDGNNLIFVDLGY